MKGTTRVLNNIIDAVVGKHLSGTELQLILVIGRMTWGSNRDEAQVTLGELADVMNSGRSTLSEVLKKLQEASNTIESAQQKKRAVERKLTDVQELPVEEAGKLFEATDTLGPAGELEA